MPCLLDTLDADACPAPDENTASNSVQDAARGLAVVAIAAVAENGVIGADNSIPWDYPADMAHFREVTTGHPVIMGRKTFENITAGLGEPLPQRTSIVLTTSGVSREFTDHNAVVEAPNLESALTAAQRACNKHNTETVYVAGGGSVYETIIPVADKLLLTRIPESPNGDAYFPSCSTTTWDCTNCETRGSVTIETYTRRETQDTSTD
ncbi:dihydrofolate reductase [Salinibaculum rarum]|uniref:dihydrofolate reductase n=1 Tax=Salinibaculum rarum TaxID=3058903 RepID=UPI00265D91B0|nr:dihydrofolate reductase [Salinibaculum sp. KK48]